MKIYSVFHLAPSFSIPLPLSLSFALSLSPYICLTTIKPISDVKQRTVAIKPFKLPEQN